MANVILRTNATPVYAFLSLIQARLEEGETVQGKKILDCGAGGILPPLALFHQRGFEAWGIDTSDEQIQRAGEFCDEQEIELHLRKGDMRQIPFEDETFDYVYEHYSMCHLSKPDTARAIHEMYRVLKKGGLCFLGVISMDTRPKSFFGEEREPGQFWDEEQGELTLHSMFTDEETDQLVSAWEIISKEKRVIFLRGAAEETSLDDWMELYQEVQDRYTQEAWKAKYAQRVHGFQYTHVYYFLRKGGEI
jgi:ubiquinone/menaquinone biosynthesis C-methylase UbiE